MSIIGGFIVTALLLGAVALAIQVFDDTPSGTLADRNLRWAKWVCLIVGFVLVLVSIWTSVLTGMPFGFGK